jgi:hypothetical protein
MSRVPAASAARDIACELAQFSDAPTDIALLFAGDKWAAGLQHPAEGPMHVRTDSCRLTIVVFSSIAVVAATAFAAGIKVRTAYDKTFDFTRVHTYAWRPSAGDVKVLELSSDDPAAIRNRLEPVIVRAVDRALGERHMTTAAASPADLRVSYYVLIGPGGSAQTMGQFLRPVPEWGVPPFAPATQSLEVYEQGTLILDMAAGDRVIWRGSAEAALDRRTSDVARDAAIHSAVREMLKKFPPKQ